MALMLVAVEFGWREVEKERRRMRENDIVLFCLLRGVRGFRRKVRE